MTKRFTHQPNYDGIRGEEFYDNRKRMRYDEVCDKLNEQDERIQELEDENEYLIKKRGELETKNVILKGENEELEKERDYYIKKQCEYFNDWNLSHLDNINLRKENEELISINNNLAKVVFKDVNFTEEDLQQAWEEYKEEIKNKSFSELFEEMIRAVIDDD